MTGFGREGLDRLVRTARRHGLTFVKVGEGGEELEFEVPPAGPRMTAAEPPPSRAGPAPKPRAPETYVRSRLVGFFAEASPALRSGGTVEPDTVVGIIEALGLPNEALAGVSGDIAEVLVEVGQPVEYGQPLARVKE